MSKSFKKNPLRQWVEQSGHTTTGHELSVAFGQVGEQILAASFRRPLTKVYVVNEEYVIGSLGYALAINWSAGSSTGANWATIYDTTGLIRPIFNVQFSEHVKGARNTRVASFLARSPGSEDVLSPIPGAQEMTEIPKEQLQHQLLPPYVKAVGLVIEQNKMNIKE